MTQKKVKFKICFLVIKSDEALFVIFYNFDRDFGTLGIGIAKIRLRIRTRHPRNRLFAKFGTFSYIIFLKNNRLGCYFWSPCSFQRFHCMLASLFSPIFVTNHIHRNVSLRFLHFEKYSSHLSLQNLDYNFFTIKKWVLLLIYVDIIWMFCVLA